jgi:hypothetical protein
MSEKKVYGLELFRDNVTSGVDGSKAPVNVVRCKKCLNIEFVIFFLVEGEHSVHQHLQCTRCETSYCSGEDMNEEPTRK